MKDGEKFTDRVLKAFQAHKGKDVLSSKIFERIYAFSLTSQFTTKQFYQHLSEINNLIKKRGSPNDIVIVYFGGQEIVDGQGHFFFLPEGKDDPELMRSCVTIDALWAYFDELMGAKLLLLDVARRPEPLGLAPGEAVDRISRMSLSNKSIGVMRFLWRQAVPVPGCILALEQETNSTQKTSLSDLETSGGRLFKQDQYAEFGVFEAHFPEELRSLILKEQP